ncbi:MAG: mechanosensitive ion channel family protein [Gammaproteobacteria bacterium]
MTEWLDPAFDWVGHFSPSPYVRALTAIVLFLLLAKLVDTLVVAAMGRLLRRWVGSRRAEAVDIGHRTIFRTVVLIGLMIATTLAGLSPRIESITLSIIDTILILLWIVAAVRGSALTLDALSQRPSPPAWARPTTAPLLNNMLRVVLALAAVYAILLAWNVNVTGLVASAGILGLALSFAAQDTLGNLFAGVAILTDQPYRIGDYIVLDSGERGQVTHVGLRSTRILTRDDEEISIPNGIIGKAKIINESGGPHVAYRLRVAIRVAYGVDIDKVMELLDARLPNIPAFVKHRTGTFPWRIRPGIRVAGLDWYRHPALRGLALSHELNCEIYRLDREGIRIPYPQRDLHIRDWQGSGTEPARSRLIAGHSVGGIDL